MVLRLAGKSTKVRPVMYPKAPSPMVSRTEPSAKMMVSSAEHSEKAYPPMVLRLARKASEVTPVFSKA